MEDPKELPPDGVKHLNLDTNTWEGWINSFVVWAAQEPWEFLYTILLILSPLFVVSLLLSWRLAKLIETQKKENVKKHKREVNVTKVRKNKAKQS